MNLLRPFPEALQSDHESRVVTGRNSRTGRRDRSASIMETPSTAEALKGSTGIVDRAPIFLVVSLQAGMVGVMEQEPANHEDLPARLHSMHVSPAAVRMALLLLDNLRKATRRHH
jgi:hypothetical protein